MRDIERRLENLRYAVTREEILVKTEEEFYDKWGDEEWRDLFGYHSEWYPIVNKWPSSLCDSDNNYCKDNPFDQARYDRAEKCVKEWYQIPAVKEESERILRDIERKFGLFDIGNKE